MRPSASVIALGSAIGQLITSLLVVATLAVALIAGSPPSPTIASSNIANLEQAAAELDPAVSLPGSLPSDFPVYPGARPTEQVVLTAKRSTSWVITWETLDSIVFVRAYYSDSLKSGDWTIKHEGTTGGIYSAVFTRTSSARFGGLMSIDDTSRAGVVTISVVLTTSTS